jgi:hypothetical protein
VGKNEAIICAPPPPGPNSWPLATKEKVKEGKVEGRTDLIARKSEYFQPVPGPGLLGLDFDLKNYPLHIAEKLAAAGGLPAVLTSIFPGFLHVASVWRPSPSAGIRNTETGEETPADAGQHHYYIVLDQTDVADFVQRLSDRLTLEGWGWGEVSKSGTMLERNLIDVSASKDTSRLWYEADAALADPRLEHVPGVRTPDVTAGGLLDTRALPPLMTEEERRLEQIRLRIIEEMRPACEAVRKVWRQERAAALIARGVDPDEANRVLRSASEKHVLAGDFEINLDDGSIVTVREILADPQAFHKMTCADPLEPEYGGGRNKAVIYTDNLPHVFSHAHGGIDYSLRQDPADVFDDLGEPEADTPPATEPLDNFRRRRSSRVGGAAAGFSARYD